MNDLLLGDLGLEIIRILQGLSQVLDAFFKLVTFLGDSLFYILIISIIYLTIQKKVAIYLAYSLIFSGWINGLLKGIIGLTRPYLAHPTEIREIIAASGYSFPSGHAQATGSFWGFLLIYYKEAKNFRLLVPVGLGFLLLVPLSRVYLGVHYPSDVIIGLFLGLGIALIFATYYANIERWIMKQSTGRLITISVVTSLSLLVVTLGATIIAGNDIIIQPNAELPGALLGLSLGLILDNKKIQFNVIPVKKWMYVTRIIIGIGLVGLFYLGVGTIFTSFKDTELEFIREFVRLASVAFVAVAMAPWIITKFEARLN